MSVGSISFWQQDQAFWSRSASDSVKQATENALITQMGDAITAQSQGLSSIANATALKRVTTELSAALQDAISGLSPTDSTSSTASSASSGSSTSAASPAAVATPAVGTGTVPLTTSTTLSSLGILKQGVITVTDGTNTTTYKSTGTDTVGNLINAINVNVFGRANVTASLDGNGKFVITAGDNTTTFTVGGPYAAAIGFGPGHLTFAPVKPPPSASASSSSTASSSSSASSSASSTSGGSSTGSGFSQPTLLGSALALQTGGTAELLLSSSGLAGTLINLLA